MDNKDKIIEEMAKDMADCNITCNECFEQLESVMTMKIKKRADHCQAYNYAERLYKAGYLKIDKDSVVLSSDNYNRLKRDSYLFEELLKKKVHLETVIELRNAQYEKVLEENKSLERLISLIDDLPKENLLDLDKSLEAIKAKERKETAEKWYYHIITTLSALWKDNKITTELYNSWIVFFNGLAKQFGVEITTDDNCKYYDKANMRCNGAKCTPECYCNGHKSECTEYPETQKQFGVEIKE